MVGKVTKWSAWVATAWARRAAENGGLEEDVGVGEEEVVGGGLAGGKGHGVGFAEPAFGEFGDVDGAEFVRDAGRRWCR